MGVLSEIEIFDCLRTNLRLAAEHAEALGKLPAKGPTYSKLREELRLVEGACRQASMWREDYRWLPLGMKIDQICKWAGEWLRGPSIEGGGHVKLQTAEMFKLFVALGILLRTALQSVEDLQHKATHRLGPILPEPLAGPHRDTRPAGWSPSESGILVPSTAALQ